MDSSNPSFDVDGDGAIIQPTSSDTEDYSGMDVLNVVSPGSGSGGADAAAAELITPSNQAIGSGSGTSRHSLPTPHRCREKPQTLEGIG